MSTAEHQSRVQGVFDAWARAGRDEGMEEGHGPAARQALERLRLRPDSRYLDIGCGNGYTVRWAAEACPEGRAVGLDLSPEMVRRARERSGSRPEFHQAAFPEDFLPAAGFDAIFSMEVFYYLPDLHAALSRVRRILAPGGLFACVVDFYGENPASHSWPADLGLDLRLLDAAGWRRAFERAGLELVEQDRLRTPGASGDQAWKAQAGSLLSLGRRPA